MAAKPKGRAGDEYDLPHELLREILNRLPVKSILRCRSVCKSWYSLVSCPNFISHYSTTNLNKNSDRVLLKLCDKRSNVWSYSSYDESFMDSCEHDYLPEPFSGQRLEIVGSCNGLICLSKYDCTNHLVSTMTLMIWNPTIRKVVEVPSRSFCSRTQRITSLGFGFDSKTSVYKVLCTSSYAEDSAFYDIANVFEIYDLRKGVWRAINPHISLSIIGHSYYPECYLDGNVHWAGDRERDDESYDRILLSFDLRDELFREIRLPDSVGFIHVDDEDANCIQTRSMTSGGLIHLITWKKGRYFEVNVPGEFSVWAMKEYAVTESWTKLFNIDLQSARLRAITNQFCLWKNGEALIVHRQYTSLSSFHLELVSYNPESNKCESAFVTTKHCVHGVILYEESLVLL